MIFLKISQGTMNSVRKGSKNSVHKGAYFHPTSTRVFRGPALDAGLEVGDVMPSVAVAALRDCCIEAGIYENFWVSVHQETDTCLFWLIPSNSV